MSVAEAPPREAPAWSPARLDRGERIRVVVIVVLLALVLVALPERMSAYWTSVVTQVAIFSVVSLGLGLLIGRVGMVSLGQVAVLALGASGTLFTGELLRLARRRRESEETGTPANLVDAAGHATRDTIAVARRGIRATPHHEAVLFNILQGFLGGFAIARLSTWGIRHGWWPAGNVQVSGRHIHHFIPGIVLAFASGIAAMSGMPVSSVAMCGPAPVEPSAPSR